MQNLSLPLPRDWPKALQRALACAVALQRLALLSVRSGFENSSDPRAQLVAEVDRLRELVALREEEIRIKDARLAAIPAPKRPHYPPPERLAVVLLRAKAGWSAAETARRFLITPVTVKNWCRRLDEDGPDALVQTRVPINKYPDFVSALVQSLHRACPSLGRRKAAELLGRAGLHLAASTVRRMREAASERGDPTPPAPPLKPKPNSSPTEARVVSAKGPHELWHVDITTMPTAFGYWCPWWPFAIVMRWLLSWHIGVVLDHYSRSLVAFDIFRQEPTARDICTLLDRARAQAGGSPRYIVSDQGSQFQSEYRAWCERNGIRPRFGAIGQHGSIAVVERFILSLKNECLRKILVPLSASHMRAELDAYRLWYNTLRPHSALRGLTPEERIAGKKDDTIRLEPRMRMRVTGEDSESTRSGKLALHLSYLRGRPHLPVVELARAA